MMRAVQIGLGSWGTDWARNVLPLAPELDVVSHVDIDRTQREKFSSRTGLPAAEAVDYADAFEAVLVTASVPAHGTLARAALAAGRHVLLEKPFALDYAEAAELVALAESRNLILVVAQNYRFFPAAQAAKQAMASIGPVRHVQVRFRNDHRFPVRTPSPDSSVLHQIAVHHFDLIRLLLGDIVAVTARPWLHGQAAGDLLSSFSATLELAGGALVQYSASTTSPTARTAWSGAWVIEGEHGTLEWSGDADLASSTVTLHRPDRPAQTVPVAATDHDRVHVVRHFVGAVAGGPAAGIGGRDNLGTVAAMLAAWTSIRSGDRVRLPG